MHPADCLKTRPKTVALIGLGVSRLAYGEQVCLDGCKTNWDEIWTVNFGGFGNNVLCFILRRVQP